MENNEFQVRVSPAMIYFQVFYVIYAGILLFQNNYVEFGVVLGMGLLIALYLYGLKPHKYVVTRRTLEMHRRVGKNKEINLISCETICDPVPKMTQWITDPHAIELYTDKNKRIVLSPKFTDDFVSAIVTANKRIHVQVKSYAMNRKTFEKKRRKELKKEERLAKKEQNIEA